jgi:hypothetical protein
MQNLKHKILLVLTVLTILGEVASIVLWITNHPVSGEPYARFSLAVDYTIAVANAVVFIVLNLVAFVLIFRRNRAGPLFLIAISILNRVISYPIFVGGAHGVFITWTALLVIFAYAEYRGLGKFEILFLSGGVLFDLAATALLFNAANSLVFGLIFYFVFLAFLVGIVVAIKKLR